MSKLVSTRNVNDLKTSKQAILKGLADDGGLYTFKDIPKTDINKLLKLNYQELAFQIISLIFDDFTEKELTACIDKAYTNTFTVKEIVKTSKINDAYLLELYHGPTSAFKDVALTILPQFLSIANSSDKVYILTATSGDTGKAALEGFKNVDNTFITVFYPKNLVSYTQEKQMNTTTGNNVEVISVNGNFDDCQNLVKECYEKIKPDNVFLSSANSINIGRLVPQIVYYFKAYFDLINQKEITLNDKVNFIVPTGNFGNILAGYIAKKMGCPINRLICVSNQNNVLTDFINTGTYDRNRPFYNTISPSMDILISSNLERLLFMLSGYNDKKTAKYMQNLKTEGRYTIDEQLLKKLQENFAAYYCDEENTKKAINKAFYKDNRLIDPHTATAYYANDLYKDEYKNIIVSTASPYKFSKNVLDALIKNNIEDELKAMEELYKLSNEEIPVNLKEINNLPIMHNKNINIEEGIKTVLERIGKL